MTHCACTLVDNSDDVIFVKVNLMPSQPDAKWHTTRSAKMMANSLQRSIQNLLMIAMMQ